MNRTILFSPIGGTDPISNTNCYDGAFLHICRVYHPTDVVMYMSAEVLEYEKTDHRYSYCLEKLCEKPGYEIRRKVIERPDLVNVQDFDWFYQEFRDVFEDFRADLDMDDTDRLLVNISSGTPAMKSGLLVLMTMGDYPATLIQVSTPEKGMNEHKHTDYQVKDLWDLDPDNEVNFVNRCKEVKCPNLSQLKNEEILKKHIENYDYHAAVQMAESMPKSVTASYLDFLKFADARIHMDFHLTGKLSRKCGTGISFFLPVTNGHERDCFEYALVLDIKRKKGEYTDFLRALTPLLVDLFEMVLWKQFGLDVDYYSKNIKGVRKWNMVKLEGTKEGVDVIDVLSQKYVNGFSGGTIYTDNLKTILDAYCRRREPRYDTLQKTMDDLRNVEEKVRNRAAHEIVSIGDEDIKKISGFSSEEIMNKIKKTFTYAGIHLTENNWNSYEIMNRVIEKQIG